MAEAEDVLVDAARHATVFARGLWARRQSHGTADTVELSQVAERLGIFVQAIFGIHPAFRVAQDPAPHTLLTRVFRRETLPRHTTAIPATDGSAIWMPRRLTGPGALGAYRCMAMLQAARIVRGSIRLLGEASDQGAADVYLLLEAAVADRVVSSLLPGLAAELESFRRQQLARRPQLADFPDVRRPLETRAREIMAGSLPEARMAGSRWSPEDSLRVAIALRGHLARHVPKARGASLLLLRDLWTGEWRPSAPGVHPSSDFRAADLSTPARSARLPRRPEVREARQDEDDESPGAWLVQSAQPAETAEDPFGMQRPRDLDEDVEAGEYADSVSELGEARLVSTPERAKEILVSDDPPDAVTRRELAQLEAEGLSYPEWDYRSQSYRHPGARVRLQPAELGPEAWVTRTLRAHRAMADDIRRRFEMLRAARVRTRKQPDGDDIDIDACVEARADFAAGLTLSQAVYQSTRLSRRDLAITLLVDVSGSTDSWISENRRIIDVEREALLLVCHALEGLREPYSVLTFSGEGPANVVMRELKSFGERYGDTVARRIAALEPEHYTRAGTALRHATARLVQQPARHRLLLLLSDGKPNDNDEYDGRYGAEDMRQSVAEARLQGIYPFCLTIDRQAAAYLPQVFGIHHYAVLQRPEKLPVVLLDWMRRLVAAA